MKKLLFVLFVLITGVASGQGNSVKPRTKTISIGGGYYLVQDLTPIIGYTRIFARYEWNSGAFDSTLYAPRYNGVPTGARVNENSDIDGKLAVDTANHRLYFYSGGSWRYSTAGTSGGTPTWQQTLTAGSTLTGDNTIAGGGFSLEFGGNSTFNAVSTSGSNETRFFNNGTYSQIRAGSTTVGPFSEIRVDKDTLFMYPYNGLLKIDSLNNLSTQNTLLGWKQGTGQGQVGYVTLGSGLSLSSGVLNTSGTVATPISSLTAATGTNSINNGDNQQTWDWSTLSSNSGLKLTTTSTAASGGGQRVLDVRSSGINSTSGQTTYSGYFLNEHTGTNSINIALYAAANNGAFSNTGGFFAASGGTNNYAIIVPASSGSVGIGTSTPTEILHVVGNIKGTNYIELPNISAPSTPGSDLGRIYMRADSLRMKNDAGTEFTLGAGGSSGITIGTTTITSGTDTRVLFDDSGVVGEDAGFTYDKTTDALTIAGNIVVPTVYGSTAANGDLILDGTSHATKTTSYVRLQPTSGGVHIGTVGGPGTIAQLLQLDGGASGTIFQITGSNPYNPALTTTYAGNTHMYTFDSQNFSTNTAGNTTMTGGYLRQVSGAYFQGYQQAFTLQHEYASVGAATLILDQSNGGGPDPTASTYKILQGKFLTSEQFAFYGDGKVVFNETGNADGDFRVEGDADANLLFTDASTDRIGIGNAAPATKFDVAGVISTDGLNLDRTITTAGTTGNQTINKMAGTVNIAAAGTTVTVTNSLVDANSIIFCTLRTNDATATIKNVVPGSGSFVITLTAAATAEVSIGFLVTN